MASIRDKIRGIFVSDEEVKNPIQQIQEQQQIANFTPANFTPAPQFTPANFTPIDTPNFTPALFTPAPQFTPVEQNFTPINFTPVQQAPVSPAVTNVQNFTPVEFTPAPTLVTPNIESNFTPVEPMVQPAVTAQNISPLTQNFTPITPAVQTTTQEIEQPVFTQNVLGESQFGAGNVLDIERQPLSVDYSLPNDGGFTPITLADSDKFWGDTREETKKIPSQIGDFYESFIYERDLKSGIASASNEELSGFDLIRAQLGELKKTQPSDKNFDEKQKAKDASDLQMSTFQSSISQGLNYEQYKLLAEQEGVTNIIKDEESFNKIRDEFKPKIEKAIKQQEENMLKIEVALGMPTNGNLLTKLVNTTDSPKEIKEKAMVSKEHDKAISYMQAYALGQLDNLNDIKSTGVITSNLEEAQSIHEFSKDLVRSTMQKQEDVIVKIHKKGINQAREEIVNELVNQYGFNRSDIAGLPNDQLFNTYYKAPFYGDSRWKEFAFDFNFTDATISPNDLLEDATTKINELKWQVVDPKNLFQGASSALSVFGPTLQEVGNITSSGIERIGTIAGAELSGDSVVTQITRTQEEMEARPWDRRLQAKKALLSVGNVTPEIGAFILEAALIPGGGASKGISLASTSRLSNITQTLYKLGLRGDKVAGIVDKTGEAIAIANRVKQVVGNTAKTLGKEAYLEARAGIYSQNQGSTSDGAFIAFGLGLGSIIELPGILRQFKQLGSDNKTINAAMQANKIISASGGETVNFLPEAVLQQASQLRKQAKKEFPNADTNTLLKQMLTEGKKTQIVVDELVDKYVREGLITRQALVKDGKYASLDSIGVDVADILNKDDFILSEKNRGLVQEMDSLAGNKDVSFERLIELTTGIDLKQATELAGAITKSPAYKVLKTVAENFPQGKPITTNTIYTKKEIENIITKSRGSLYDFSITGDDGKLKYFDKVDGGYKLKVSELGEDIGIKKLALGDDDLAKLAGTDEGLVKAMDTINEKAGSMVYDINYILNSGVLNPIKNILVKILC